jgi:hypothetical protein
VKRSSTGIIIEARALNQTSKPMAKLFVIMTTESLDGWRRGDALYEFKAHLTPGTWTALRESESREQAEIGARPPMDVLVAPVRSCFVQGFEYPDGSREILYMPL